ncbi:MAG: permease-like cell division protein FtsX [Bacteroidia bacterium]
MRLVQDSYRYLKRRARSTFATALVSIGLVLYFVGIFAGLLLMGRGMVQQVEETLEMRLFLHEGMPEAVQRDLAARLQRYPFVSGLRYVSKEEAARIMYERSGDDVRDLLAGNNPYPAAYYLRLHPAYFNADSLAAIQARLEQELPVTEVLHEGAAITAVNNNLRMLTLVAIGMAVLLSVAALMLVSGTIRLAIYSQRLAIRSMELIGATRRFIRRPFLVRGVVQGSLGGLLATLLLGATWLGIQYTMRQAGIDPGAAHYPRLIGLLGGIVLFGLALGYVGSFLAVSRFLNRNLDELL